MSEIEPTQLEEPQADTPRRLAKVVIEVLGGVVEVTSKPDNIDVEIIDHDNEAADGNDL